MQSSRMVKSSVKKLQALVIVKTQISIHQKKALRLGEMISILNINLMLL